MDRTVSVQIRAAATTPAPAGGQRSAVGLAAGRHQRAAQLPLLRRSKGRVVGAVDEQQFLTETVYDDALNTQRTLRYLTPVTVAPGDTLASLKSRAGASRQTSLVAIRRLRPSARGHRAGRLDGDAQRVRRGRPTHARGQRRGHERAARPPHASTTPSATSTATLGGEGDAWLGTNPTPQRISEAIRDYGIRHEYDTLGRAIRSVDANGNTTLFYYDRENRPTHTINVIGHRATNTLAGEVSETTYNSFGQTASVGAPLRNAAR